MDPLLIATVLLSGVDTIDGLNADGARQAVVSESLPANISGREKWEALGFVFGEPFADDKMFCPATLPPGWSKQRTEHNMWNDIVDGTGNVRGSFFYKAAFYDRDAFMHPPLARYHVTHVYPDGPRPADPYDGHRHVCYDVLDRVGGRRMFRASCTVELLSPEKGGDQQAWWDEHRDLEKAMFAQCEAWLDANFPDHKDAAAYWP